MAESFNELGVQHEWEEITRVYKGYKHSTHCAMIHAQYEYKYGKDRYIPRAGHARISLNTVQEAQDCSMVHSQYELKHGSIGTRPVLAMLNHCTRGTRTVTSTKTGKMYITRAGHARPLYKRYKHSTHCKRYNHSTSKNTGQ